MTATCLAGRCAGTIVTSSPASMAGNRRDLFVYNHQDWSTQYLGTMVSNGTVFERMEGRLDRRMESRVG